MDGTALKVRMMVKNASGRIIKEGTRIEISVYAKNSRFGIGRSRPHTARSMSTTASASTR